MGSAARRVTMPQVVDWLQRHSVAVSPGEACEGEGMPESSDTLFDVARAMRSALCPPTVACWPAYETVTSGSS